MFSDVKPDYVLLLLLLRCERGGREGRVGREAMEVMEAMEVSSSMRRLGEQGPALAVWGASVRSVETELPR